MSLLEKIKINSWDVEPSALLREKVIKALEEGKVVYFPELAFDLVNQEKKLLSPDKTHPKSKNISYDIRTDALTGTQCSETEAFQLQEMIRRYALLTRQLVERLYPRYSPHLYQARTSYRPIEIAGRKTSLLKDDTLLHVDSFPATPTKGNRILRIFTNINPEGKPRVWRVGEPFPEVVRKMAPRLSTPWAASSFLLKLFKITKDYRTLYDHYMLQLHDNMKRDPLYQKEVPQEKILFSSGVTWMVYTDQVSHAAMSGQYVLEQTFHLPPAAMQYAETTPLTVLEKHFKKKLA
jgi:3-deoxy-D-manno-oct-2-ulosonic acid (Kdo) hydroxylase